MRPVEDHPSLFGREPEGPLSAFTGKRITEVGAAVLSASASVPTGEDLKAEGMARVARFSSRQARDQLDAAIRALADTAGEFTAVEVRSLLPLKWDGAPNLIGSRLSFAAREGRIQPIGFRKGTLPSQHGRVLQVWRGAESWEGR